jgi:exopolysaccharide production protein ExoQ
MNPSLASLLTTIFICYLFKRDFRKQPNISNALWIPWLWMIILGSRYVTEWLNLGSSGQSWGVANDYQDGSPIDRMVFFLLLAAALYVLWKRHISWAQVLRNNVWIALFLLYCVVSTLWSDFPFVAFKRWIKILGHPLMSLLIFSEHEPVLAIKTVIKRCAYVLIPISVLYIKYYPHLGRGFDQWTGEAVNFGVTTNKNALGILCVVFGLFFFCDLLSLFGKKSQHRNIMEKSIVIIFLYMILWLLQMNKSATALIALIISIFVVVALGFPFIKKNLEICICIGIAIFFILQITFNITEIAILSLGKNLTLTDRTEVWAAVLKMNIDPLIGTGFESFWLGKRLETLWAEYWWQPNQAHNGYLEVYINLGYIGLFFLGGAIFSSFRNMRKTLIPHFNRDKSEIDGFDFGRFRMALLVAILVYNITEATFKALHTLFWMFFVIAIEYKRVQSEVIGSNTRFDHGINRLNETKRSRRLERTMMFSRARRD